MKQVQKRYMGPLLLAVAILINRFLSGSDFLNFLEGLLTGLSIVLNISYILKRSEKQVQIQ